MLKMYVTVTFAKLFPPAEEMLTWVHGMCTTHSTNLKFDNKKAKLKTSTIHEICEIISQAHLPYY
jgi:hypothetical protein